MLPDSFFAKVEPEPNSGCWLWLGGLNRPDGYGRTTVDGEVVLAHVAAFRDRYGPPPDDTEVMHSCDVRICVNPAHLSAGTHTDNMVDMAAKGRNVSGRPFTEGQDARRGRGPSRRDSCGKGHPFTPSNTYEWKGRRSCRECHRLVEAARRQARGGGQPF